MSLLKLHIVHIPWGISLGIGILYFLDKFIEKKLDEGDAVIFYGSIVHGVEKVDPKEKLLWETNKGRWFMGMFVNDSDHVKNRITAKDLTGSIKKH